MPGMKITIKTMNKGAQPQNFDIEVQPEETILKVKEKVQAERNEFDVTSTKLICSGKILQNEKTVAESNVKEGDFIVVVAGKKAAAPPPPTAGATTSSGQQAGGSSAPATTSTPQQEGGGATNDGGAPAQNAPVAAATATTGREMEAALTQLTDMGFPREECIRALQAAYGNPDRAVEYLMNGIPENMEGAAPPAATPSGGAAGVPGGAAVVPPPGGAGAAPGEGVAGFQGTAFPSMEGGGQAGAVPPAGGAAGGAPPNMQAIQQMMAENPQLLQQLIAQIGQTNPEMLQALQQNPEMLMAILAGQMGGGEGGMPPGAGAGMPPGGQMPAGGGGPQPGQMQIQLTPEDQAAVERLEQLGFPRHAVVQAYMAAEKNEELAANLLFDMGDDL